MLLAILQFFEYNPCMLDAERMVRAPGTEQIDGWICVHVKLMSRFRKYLPDEAQGEADIELPHGATLNDLVGNLAIQRRVKLFAVNDEHEKDLSRVLCDGDFVRIYPFVVGG
jgi:sulfur carrier protein ThiS